MASMPGHRRRAVHVRRRRIALVLVLSVLLAAAAAWGVEQLASGTPSGSPKKPRPTRDTTATTVAASRPTAPAVAPSTFAVGTTTLDIQAAAPGGGDVSMPAAVYYPATVTGDGAPPDRAFGPYPLVVFSQGFDEDPAAYAVLLQAWAAAGFVVAAPTYPHTDPGPDLDESDISNHPAELTGAITAMIAASDQADTPVSGLVNGSEVAIAGQSDGGDVTLATAADTCCRDARVKAALILSGAELGSLPGSYYGDGSPPLLVVQGSDDSAAQGNAPVCSAELYDAAPAPKYYLDLLGAGHLAPYTEVNGYEGAVAQTTTAFLDAYLRSVRDPLDALVMAGTLGDLASITTIAQVPSPGGTC